MQITHCLNDEAETGGFWMKSYRTPIWTLQISSPVLVIAKMLKKKTLGRFFAETSFSRLLRECIMGDFFGENVSADDNVALK